MITEKWTEVPFARLEIGRREIYLNMGSGRYIPDPEMVERVECSIRRIAAFCRPKCGYRIFASEAADSTKITLGGRTISCGSVINPILCEAEYLCVFVATAGVEFQQWMEGEAHSGDILREFVSNNIGSEIAEATARIAAAELAAECKAVGLGTGNSYSPGYCGWPLTDQQVIFSLLPPAPCGIILTDSCLLLPIKSVSGIIPVGKDVVKRKYACAICDRTDCYKKINRQTILYSHD